MKVEYDDMYKNFEIIKKKIHKKQEVKNQAISNATDVIPESSFY